MKMQCLECLIDKEESEFYKDTKKKSGRFSVCILCSHIRDQIKYQKKHNNLTNRGPGKFERSKKSVLGIYWCSDCREWKDGEYFHNSRSNRYGKHNQCKSCKNLYEMSTERKKARKAYSKQYRSTKYGKYVSYKGSARHRQIGFSLTLNEFESFWQKPCYYCDSPIKTIGLDRKDNSIGYIYINCVSCCKICNFDFKRGYTDKDFLAHIYKIAKKHFARTVA